MPFENIKKGNYHPKANIMLTRETLEAFPLIVRSKIRILAIATAVEHCIGRPGQCSETKINEV